MQRILTAKQMRDADDFTIKTLGIPEEELVDRAGEAVAVEILKRKKGGRVLICCGKGNNGEDGKIVAKTLYPHHGFAVNIFDIYYYKSEPFTARVIYAKLIFRSTISIMLL